MASMATSSAVPIRPIGWRSMKSFSAACSEMPERLACADSVKRRAWRGLVQSHARRGRDPAVSRSAQALAYRISQSGQVLVEEVTRALDLHEHAQTVPTDAGSGGTAARAASRLVMQWSKTTCTDSTWP